MKTLVENKGVEPLTLPTSCRDALTELMPDNQTKKRAF